MEDIREQLKLAMEAMEAQRETLGDAVVDAALAAFREKLAAVGQRVEPDAAHKSRRSGGEPLDMPSHRVRGVRPRVFCAAGQLDRSRASMVGREAERSQLLAAFASARGERELRAVTIAGEVGVGKTRLAQEFLKELEYSRQPFTLFRGHGDWQQNRLPHALLRELISFHFKIEASDPTHVARDKLLRGVESWMGPDGAETAHWIGHLAGYDFEQSPYLSGRLDDPRRARQLAFQAFNRLIAVISRQTPLVVLVDDLQWADDNMLDWLDSLAHLDSSNPHSPSGAVLLLGLARPSLFERHPAWGERWPDHDRMNLLPLNTDHAAALAGQLLRNGLVTPASFSAPTHRRKPGMPEPVDALAGVIARPVQVIVDRAKGNPYFIEELAQSLLEDCLFTLSAGGTGDPAWRLDTDRLEAKRLPCSLIEVIQARLADLPAGEGEVLLRAAVIGPVFWESAVRSLLEKDDGPETDENNLLHMLDLPAVLRALQERGFVERREHSAFEHTDEYAFKNALLYEVAYERQLVRGRRQDHARVAMWLAAQNGQRVGINTAVIARHYERAEERLLAADWYGLAALQAGHSSAPDTAQRFFGRALELLPDEPSYFGQRVQFYKSIWDIQWWLTRYDDALATGQALLAAAEARGDLIVQASALNRIAAVQNRQGEYQAALRSVQRAERLARSGGAAREVVLALFNRGVTLYRLGDADAALEAGERALAFNQSLFGKSGASSQDLARAAGQLDGPSADQKEQALRMEELRDAFSRGSSEGATRRMPENDETERETARILNLLALINQRAGRFAEAEKDYRQVLFLQRERGDRGAVMAVFNSLGALASAQGDYHTAASCFQQALSLAQEIGFHELDLVCMNNLSGAEVELGEYRKAETRLSEVLVRADRSTSFLLTETFRFMAQACLGQQRHEEALTAGLRALDLARQGRVNEHIGRAWRVLGHILAAFDPKSGRAPVVIDGQECSAHTCYAASLQIFVEMGAAGEQARTARELALFELERGDHREGARLWQESRDLFARLGLDLEVERMDNLAVSRSDPS